ncbi:MAG: D-glycero-alpha-D-manno-heptose-1,7-bisphosphate 7-phosphatase [Alphaproteobacteria bacterium]
MPAGQHIRADGNWFQMVDPLPGDAPRPTLFLDRDGTLIEQVHHLDDPAGVRLIAGAAPALAALRGAGWRIVLVTNQSGIGRDLFGWDAFAAVQAAMLERLAAAGATLDLVAACPFHPSHPWRKPAPGMLLAAAAALPVDMGRSRIVGDKAGDLAAGRAAGLPRGCLVATGYGPAERDAARALAAPCFRVDEWPSIAAAAVLAGSR